MTQHTPPSDTTIAGTGGEPNKGHDPGRGGTVPSDTTIAAEQAEANKGHEAGRGPTPEEDAAAPVGTSEPGVAAHEEEMAQRGANVEGEGKLP